MPDTMTFQFLDVGMGDSTLVQIRRRDERFDRLVLVDCGERRTPLGVAPADALAYLTRAIGENSHARRRRRPYIDYLIITHPDGDHYNRVPDLLDATFPHYPTRRLRIGDLYYGGNAAEYGRLITRTLVGRVNALDGLDPMSQNYHSRVDGANRLIAWRTFGDVNLYVLSANWPSRGTRDRNVKSIVLMFELDGQKVILTGDATRATERHILRDVVGRDPSEVSCHALKLGHHGSNGSTSDAWVAATAPFAIFASGDQVWAHPYCRPICKFIDGDHLRRQFRTNSYYTCGDLGRYFNNRTRLAIGMNLFYEVARRRERLYDEDAQRNVWARRGTVYGVQWALSIVPRRRFELLRTDTCRPQDANVNRPFDCAAAVLGDGRRDELLALIDVLPAATDPAPA
ncbi:ComEC/Rec2 family competence protein [Conexibacter woesei]|uniref:Beta-lactamase domain protein n=1 Tax=Conexibacter woesei (strain DSM 14684 / CCUG 47730 / CIP 108061 / JCM 11494 / NBRC 100937 / ID131577) TaxID=469383 RepID=D3FD75_CONWI|nr:MBL fold protein [Conexibacter woesei]ADB53467.1 beta-lactamase domain protein [Conexibacter woesei DSM 14684]